MLMELRHTLRSLLRARGLTLVVIITLALGIGASTAIFSVVNTVLLRPLPYAQPEQLTRICQSSGCFWISPPEFFDLKRETQAWSSIEAWVNAGVNIATANEPARVTASFVTGGLLNALGIRAAMGRGIAPSDGAPGASPVAVISHGLWQRAFGAQPDTVGREILINGRASIIVGIMPQGFQFPQGGVDLAEVWAPLQLDPANPGIREAKFLNVIARLNPQVTLSQAQSQLDATSRDWKQRFPESNSSLVVRGLHDELVGGVRPALQMLMASVCFLLLIACMNVANLLLARAEARQSETSIRVALGAGLWRLGRQFATEGLMLSLAGAAIGLLLAFAGLELIKSIGGSGIPRVAEIAIDGRVVWFALGMSVLTGLVFGLAPLIHTAKRNLQGAMKSSAAATTDTGGAQKFRQILVVSQLALALILLTGTGLMLRAFWKLQEVRAGFDPKGVITLPVGLTSSREANQDFVARVEGRLAELPGVQSVALSTVLPPVNTSQYRGSVLDVEGFKATENSGIHAATVLGRLMPVIDFYHSVSKGYFNTLRIPLVEGRLFDGRDNAQAAKVVIVNQTTARLLWGNESAIGHRVRLPLEEEWRTVIGVIADVKNDGLEKPTATEVYMPYFQSSDVLGNDTLHVVLRSQGDPALLVSAVRREINRINPTLPLLKARTLDAVMSASQSRPRFLTLLLGLFSSVALVLASVGIYGVISYSVAQRTREFGIRMALGARQGAVLGLVVKNGVLLTVCGLVSGLAGALALTRFLSSFLFGITATDPATFVGVSIVLAAIAILATYIPARRATRVDPIVALRTE